MVRAYVAWATLYKYHPFGVVQSYEDSASSEWVRQVAVLITKPHIVADYGEMFPFSGTREEMNKASMRNWELRNGSKVMSRSLGQTLRGANADT
jgi:hypothetical protein